MEKFIEIFDANFVITMFCLIFVLLAVAIDLYNGIQKAKKNGIARRSEGFRRTAEKLKTYYSLMFLCVLADVIIAYVILEYKSFVPVIPYITIAITIWFIFTEWRSVKESAEDKLQKDVNKSGTELLQILQIIKDKDILQLLKDLENKENKN